MGRDEGYFVSSARVVCVVVTCCACGVLPKVRRCLCRCFVRRREGHLWGDMM